MKQDFVFDREKKKAQVPDGQGEERNLQKKQIRKSSLRKEAISEEHNLEDSCVGRGSLYTPYLGKWNRNIEKGNQGNSRRWLGVC